MFKLLLAVLITWVDSLPRLKQLILLCIGAVVFLELLFHALHSQGALRIATLAIAFCLLVIGGLTFLVVISDDQ